MIKDEATNFLYLADTLPIKYPDFFGKLKLGLEMLDIPYVFLPGTKDVWAKDYMPIQIAENKFIQFIYDPRYLKGRWENTRSDPDQICKDLNIITQNSSLKIDGGNVVKWDTKAIVTSRIYKENEGYQESPLREALQAVLEINELIVVPEQPYEFTGHADGLIRFIDKNKVFINDLSAYSATYQKRLTHIIRKAGLEPIELPIGSQEGQSDESAIGCYINYLEMEQGILVPQFGSIKDVLAMEIFKTIFPSKKIVPINCNELAVDGGILNCISWAIKK